MSGRKDRKRSDDLMDHYSKMTDEELRVAQVVILDEILTELRWANRGGKSRIQATR